ncbi:MAG: hypothetical protein GWN10_19970, partial [Nitrospinaceae bacterium]|nr:hypothetical protein [Nitrospinaceae bacterium]NIW07819.1 hypothetical protein [Nitrospinaceae bacterium]NIX36422.1 hypothetical protein [Nitrospinaceae bacterium]
MRINEFKKILGVGVLILGLLISPPARSEPETAASQVIFGAMQEEMDRSLRNLRFEDFSSPYFIAYQVRHNLNIEIRATLGALL